MKMRDWLEERTGLPSMWQRFADHPTPGGPRLAGVLPAIIVYLFIQQAVLGVLIAAHYSPSASDAWASTAFLNDQLASGWFIRGMHHYGTSAILLTLVVYLGQQALSGDYRRPREFVWIATVALLIVTMALGVTGNILPWDEQGYWAAQVELGIMEGGPGGEAMRTVVQGGADAGNLTLTRLFTAHAFILPLAAGLLLAAIVSIGRRAQRAQAEAMPTKSAPFAPGQLVVDMAAMLLVAVALAFITIKTHGSELYGPADPTSNFQARPEWYFLFLFKLRSFFDGPLEPVATMVIPGAVVGFVISAPFIERATGKVGRVGVRVLLGLIMAGVVALTGLSMSSDASNESYQKSVEQAHVQAQRARGFAKDGVLPEGGPAVFRNDPEYKLRALFTEHCESCHELDGVGGEEAPSLTDYSSRQWLAALVRDPNAMRFFGGTIHEDMDPYPEVATSDEQTAIEAGQLDALVEYLVQLQGDEGIDVTLAEQGKALWDDELDCNGCHEITPGEEGSGPNLLGHGSVAWVGRVIRDSSAADLFGSEAQMPKFGEDKLSEEQVAALAAFIVRQRQSQ